MASEGRLFRDAYESLDRLAPVAPDFGQLGLLKLTSVPAKSNARSPWFMAAATVTVIAVIALIPLTLFRQSGSSVGQGVSTGTTGVGAVSTTTCGEGTTTIPPTEAPPVGPVPTTTSTISEGIATTAHEPCPPTTAPGQGTTVPPGPTTTTIEPSEPNLVFTDQDAEEYLVEFFDRLRNGRHYPAAVSMYGGSYDQLIEWNPPVDPNDSEALFESGCTHQLRCDLLVREVVSVTRQGDVFTLTITFDQPDGTPFAWEGQDTETQDEWTF